MPKRDEINRELYTFHDDTIVGQKCSRCGEMKFLDDYGVNRSNRTTGKQRWCRECCRSYHRTRRGKEIRRISLEVPQWLWDAMLVLTEPAPSATDEERLAEVRRRARNILMDWATGQLARHEVANSPWRE